MGDASSKAIGIASWRMFTRFTLRLAVSYDDNKLDRLHFCMGDTPHAACKLGISMFWKRYQAHLMACILVVGAIYYSIFCGKNEPDQEPKVVEVEVVALKDMQRTETFIGTVQAKRATTLVAKAQGVLDVVAQPGQKVNKNDVIARIINQHSSQTFELEEEREKVAKQQYERAQELHTKGALSKSELVEKKNTWINAAKSKVDAQEKCSNALLQAPFDGIVGLFKVQEGNIVRENDVIVSVFDPSTLEVRFDIPHKILPSLTDQTFVYVQGKPYPLTHVQRMLDPTTHMCPAYVKLQGDDFVIGGTLDVDVVVEEQKQVIVIPHAALFMKDGQTSVFCIEKGKAKLKKVECGARQKDAVVVTKGLQVGDTIIRCYPSRIYPGSKVRLAEATP